MTIIGYVGRREDNHEISQAMLFQKGDAPTVRGWTSDTPPVRVMGTYLFELDFGEKVRFNSPEFDEKLRRTLMNALVTVVATGLTPEQRNALAKFVPEFTLCP